MKLDQSALTIYQAKSNKNVIILSTLHTTVTVDQEKKKKPETITFYTETEYGVDILDQWQKIFHNYRFEKMACSRFLQYLRPSSN